MKEKHLNFVSPSFLFQKFSILKKIDDLREICYSKVNSKQDGRISQWKKSNGLYSDAV